MPSVSDQVKTAGAGDGRRDATSRSTMAARLSSGDRMYAMGRPDSKISRIVRLARLSSFASFSALFTVLIMDGLKGRKVDGVRRSAEAFGQLRQLIGGAMHGLAVAGGD